jgi:hypothetical protein
MSKHVKALRDKARRLSIANADRYTMLDAADALEIAEREIHQLRQYIAAIESPEKIKHLIGAPRGGTETGSGETGEEVNTYRIYFQGHYPVGAVAVVTADSPREAAELLMVELAREGLAPDNSVDELESEAALLDLSVARAHILLGGDY